MGSELSNPRIRIDIAVKLAIAVFFGFFCFISLAGWFNPEYVYLLERGHISFAKDRFENPRLDELDLFVRFRTASFSAQNPIKVELSAYPSYEFDNKYVNNTWSNQEEIMHAIFPPAFKYPLTQSTSSPFDYKGGIVNMTREDSPRRFYGEAHIVYEFSGNYTFYLIDQDWLGSHTLPGGRVAFSPEDIQHRTIASGKYFEIGSSDQTSTLKNNNLIFFLTFIFLGFASYEFRDSIVTLVEWVNSLFH